MKKTILSRPFFNVNADYIYIHADVISYLLVTGREPGWAALPLEAERERRLAGGLASCGQSKSARLSKACRSYSHLPHISQIQAGKSGTVIIRPSKKVK